MIALIIIISVILILFVIAFGAKYKHYLEDKAKNSLIFNALAQEVGKTTFKEATLKLGDNYLVINNSTMFKRIRYNISKEDIKNYKRFKYRKSKVIQLEFKDNILFKVEVL